MREVLLDELSKGLHKRIIYYDVDDCSHSGGLITFDGKQLVDSDNNPITAHLDYLSEIEEDGPDADMYNYDDNIRHQDARVVRARIGGKYYPSGSGSIWLNETLWEDACYEMYVSDLYGEDYLEKAIFNCLERAIYFHNMKIYV